MRDTLLISFPFPAMRSATKKWVLVIANFGILLAMVSSLLQRGEHSVCGSVHDEIACFQRL